MAPVVEEEHGPRIRRCWIRRGQHQRRGRCQRRVSLPPPARTAGGAADDGSELDGDAALNVLIRQIAVLSVLFALCEMILPDGKVVIVCVLYDMTEEVKLKNVLIQESSYDALTGLYNRRGLDKQLEKLFAEPEKLGYSAFIMIDADGLKGINDTYGHEAGDIVLTTVARLAENSLGLQDVIGRYGGEEFIILLPERDVTEAVEVADAVRVKIAESLVRIDDKKISVTASFGVSHVHLVQADFKEAIKLAVRRADHALYAAKDNGRNNVQLYKEDS